MSFSYFPQMEVYFILESRFLFLIWYISLESGIHLDCLGNIRVINIPKCQWLKAGRATNLAERCTQYRGILDSSWAPFVDRGQENCAGSYCVCMQVRHIISLFSESRISMPNFKELRVVRSCHLSRRQSTRNTCETTNDLYKRCHIIPIS